MLEWNQTDIIKGNRQKTMQKGVLNMKEIAYSRQGDYLLPNITVPAEAEPHLGKYASLRRNYLKEQHYGIFITLLTQGKLTQHLKEIQEEAQNRMGQLIAQMAQAQGVTEELKAKDQMAWAGRMGNIHQAAEELIMAELIYN